MSLGILGLEHEAVAILGAFMDLATLRQHFKAERKRLRKTQVSVAAMGGIEQSAVSKIESDPTYTPQVDTFINAVEGLGITVSSFFAGIENRHKDRSEIAGALPPGAEHGRALPVATPSKDDQRVQLPIPDARTFVDAVRLVVDLDRRTRKAAPVSKKRPGSPRRRSTGKR